MMWRWIKQLFLFRSPRVPGTNIWMWKRDAWGRVTKIEYSVGGSIGLSLLGTRVEDGGLEVLLAERCPDRSHFWRLWKHFNPDVQLNWEDGTAVELGERKRCRWQKT